MNRPLSVNKFLKLVFQVVIWIGVFTVPFVVSPHFQLNQVDLIRIVSIRIPSFLCLVFYYYLNLNYLIPKFLFNKKTALYIGLVVCSFFAVVFVFFLTFKFLVLSNAGFNIMEFHSYRRFGIFSNLLFFVLISAISIGLAYSKDRANQSKIKNQIEIEKLQSELALLKLQISPHFLFNTLNNIRYLARKKSDNAEQAIMQLSDILRHITYDANNETVTLASEILLIHNVTELQRLRLESNNKIHFHSQVEHPNIRIAPLLFMSLIENAFKYGFIEGSENMVEISLVESNFILDFEITNSILGIKKDSVNSGLGLKNLKRRLELSYPKRHRFDIIESDKLFKVKMNINLKES